MNGYRGAQVANENMHRRNLEEKLDRIVKLLEKLLETKEDDEST